MIRVRWLGLGWPELHRAAEYRVEVFSEAAKALQKTDARYRDVRKRIAQDAEYASAIGSWVVIVFNVQFRRTNVFGRSLIDSRLLGDRLEFMRSMKSLYSSSELDPYV